MTDALTHNDNPVNELEYLNAGHHKITNQTKGDIIYAADGSVISRIPIGMANQVLNVSGGIPAWTSSPTVTTLGAATGNVTTLNTTTANITTLNAPTGRTASYVIAASNSVQRAQADYVCTGTADQILINSVIASLPNYQGGTVFLMAGNYNITAPILITRRGGANAGYGRVRLIGEGANAITSIQLTAGSNCDMIWTNGVDIQDIEVGYLHLSGQTTNASGHGLNADGMTYGYFHDLTISNCKQDGFHSNSGDDSVSGGTVQIVQNIIVAGCGGYGFCLRGGSMWCDNLRAYANNAGFITTGTENYFSRFSADTNATYGMYVTYCSDSRFINCWIGQNVNVGLFLPGVVYNCQFNSFVIQGNETTPDGQGAEVCVQGNTYNCTFSQFDVRNAGSIRAFFLNNTHNNTFNNNVIVVPNGTAFFDYVSPYGNTSSIFTSNQITATTPFAAQISGEPTNIIRSNIGVNPTGLIVNPIGTNGTIATIGMGGSGSTVVTATVYTVTGADCFITSTAAGVSNIAIKDAGGNVMLTGVTTLTNQFVPIGYSVTWTWAVTGPTVTVFGN